MQTLTLKGVAQAALDAHAANNLIAQHQGISCDYEVRLADFDGAAAPDRMCFCAVGSAMSPETRVAVSERQATLGAYLSVDGLQIQKLVEIAPDELEPIRFLQTLHDDWARTEGKARVNAGKAFLNKCKQHAA